MGVAVVEGIARPSGPCGDAGNCVPLFETRALLPPAVADFKGEAAPVQALIAPPDQVAPGEFLVVAAIEVLVLVRQLPGSGPRLVDRLVWIEEAVANGRAQRHPR